MKKIKGVKEIKKETKQKLKEMVKSLEECTCRCHISGSTVKHRIPCCRVCPGCGKNIIKGLYSKHLKECSWMKYKKSVDKRLK